MDNQSITHTVERESDPPYGVLLLEPVRNREQILTDLRIKSGYDWLQTYYAFDGFNTSSDHTVSELCKDQPGLLLSLLRQLEQSGYAAVQLPSVDKRRVQWRITGGGAGYVAFLEVSKTEPFPSVETNVSDGPVLPTTQTQAELIAENRELNIFFDLALELHCITDRNGSIQKINSAWETTLGYNQTELFQVNYLDLVHPDDMIAALAGTPYLNPRMPAQRKRFRLRKKAGGYVDFIWYISFVEDRVYASGREVLEGQQAERAGSMEPVQPDEQVYQEASGESSAAGEQAEEFLTQSEERFRAIFNLTYQFIGLMRPDGILLEVNETALQAAGQPLSAVIGKPFWETYWWKISEKERQKLKLAIQQAAKGELVRYEVEIVDANHEIRALDMSIKPIINSLGQVVLLIPEGRDITKKKRAENALRESEQRFREIAENVNDAFWIHSAYPFELLYINPAFERGVGYSAQQLREQPELLLEAVPAEDRPRILDDFAKYRKGDLLTGQYRLLGANKMVRWFAIRTFIMKDCEGQPLRYIGVASDITSQKEKELVLQQALAREKELNKLKSQFVSIASHEFRTPLATIQSSVDLISLYLSKSTSVDKVAVSRHVGVIENEITAFSKLLTDVLTIGKMDEGRITFNPHYVDLIMLCDEVVTTHFGNFRDGRRVQLTIEGTPFLVYLDDQLIKHVLINLLTNAFKFSKDNPTLEISYSQNQVQIRVIDQGMGIPQEDISSLFQPFFRAGNASSVQGTGLGLAISRQFVELHGGYFNVHSEQYRGATFTVTLPVHRE